MASDQRKQQRARLREVATHAGVSPITAWRVLNQPQLVAPKTAERVRRSVEAIGYVPDAAARSLVSSRSRVVGMVVPSIVNWMFADTVQGTVDALREHGLELLIACSDYQATREEDIVRTMLGRRPEGLILTGHTHTDAMRRLLVPARVPVVEIWDHADDAIDMSVGFSATALTRAVVDHFVARGRRRIGFVGTSGRSRSRQRQTAFARALEQLGLPHDPGLFIETDDTLEGGGAGLMRLLAADPTIDAVFLNGDTLAIGGLMACLERQIAVPERLALMGFGDLDIASHVMPRLSTVRLPRSEIGRVAADLLVNRLAGTVMPHRRIDLGFEIIERETG